MIFQASLHQSVIPIDWKLARVVPILCRGSLLDPSDVLPPAHTGSPAIPLPPGVPISNTAPLSSLSLYPLMFALIIETL